ncbi:MULTISPECIES: hypothetical protein [Leptolyngbya]|uniref:hypothetical protein n=1 Tax=Leptolyngbya TaxID=47251 RepID=UPI0016823D1B|nr:hypothetical protein [Leptolyngbya sp. FACHB-1624]MBD1857659.1 hypothetical protein [Leptolyngbya sp. FACHB-1624]
MDDTLLLVPIYVDALWLQNEQQVVDAMADFSRLPYLDKHLKREINADTANISEAIVSQSFQSQTLNLKPGVHLHWALPDELAVGTQKNQGWCFPAVPNRWLVTRYSSDPLRSKSWIVESDYIHSPEDKNANYIEYVCGKGANSGSISYYYREIDQGSDEPFRYVGRQVPLELWIKEDTSHTSYFPPEHPLTAIGYGELAFAAFYPNCRSVFGFHDDEVIQDMSGYQYEVIGWYQDRQQKDSVKQLLNLENLQESKWKISGAISNAVPDQLLFYSKLIFKGLPSTEPTQKDVTIAVGTTPMEALSTYLAHQLIEDKSFKVSPSDRDRLLEQFEEQLEFLHLSSELSNAKLDRRSKLRAYKHDAGFQAISGGDHWQVRVEIPSNQSQPANRQSATTAQTQPRLELPVELAQQLKHLNYLQRAYNQAEANLSSLRQTLFADWYKYMLSVYQPPDMVRGDDYPDTDKIRFFIREKDIKPLASLFVATEQLKSQSQSATQRLENLIGAYNASLLAHIRAEGNSILSKPARSQSNETNPAVTNCTAAANPSSSTQSFRNCLDFNGTTTYVKAKWQQPAIDIKSGFTVSAWIYPRVSDRALPFTIFSIGTLKLQLQPRFLITLPMLAHLRDCGFSDPQLLVLANTIEAANQASDRAAFPTAEKFLEAISDKNAFVGSEEKLLNAIARIVLTCPGIDDYITVVDAEQWCHVALTYEPTSSFRAQSRLSVSVEGRSFPLQLDNPLIPGQFDAIFIGAEDQSGKAGFLGQMNQIRVDQRSLSEVEVRRDMTDSDRPIYQLQTDAAPRFWQPTEPVILIAGSGVKETERHGQDSKFDPDGKLECLAINSIPNSLKGILNRSVGFDMAQFRTEMSAFSQTVQTRLEASTSQAIALNWWKPQPGNPLASTSQAIALNWWNPQPWNPLFLEWEVSMQPVLGKTNVEGLTFAADMITANYELPNNGVDLAVKPNRNQLGSASIYSNSCVLTSQTSAQMLEKLGEFLQQFLDQLNEANFKTLPEFYQPQQRALKLTFERLEKLKTWYKETLLYDSTNNSYDLVYVAICAGLKLFDQSGDPIPFLSQSLSGFNAELLMHKQTLQLPVEDPLSFGEDQTFTQEVARALAGNIQTAPEPANKFNPIRSGAMSITRLRLIDTFGQVKDFNQEDILTAGKEILTPKWLTVPGSPHLVWLPPRLVQPTRIDFRWLSAWEEDLTATPICGWVLPNNLAKSLVIFDEAGKALGSILQRGSMIQWEPAPGRNRQVDEIANPHLRRMVEHILSKGDAVGDSTETDENFLVDLLTTIAGALETIDPESHAQHRSLALLMGRPLAIVRARLNFELQGEPAINQGWHAFKADMERTTRQSDQFTRVRFPIRIGAQERFNDGVVGYWRETLNGYEYNKFYAPQTPNSLINRSIDHPDIVIDDQLWIEKQAFTEAFGEQGTLVTQELLRIGWLKALGEETPWMEVIAMEERSLIPLGMLTHLSREINQLLAVQSVDPLHILQTIDSPPQFLTMMIDPRAEVHITSGFLPTKTISIPVEDYASALEAIEVSFLTAPILTERGTRRLSFPKEPGFDWTWLEHKRWLSKDIFTESLQAQGGQFADEAVIEQLWTGLQNSGWLKPANNGDRLRIVPMGRRTSEKLSQVNLAALGMSNQSESISQIEDYIEQLFWTKYTTIPVIDREVFFSKLTQREKATKQIFSEQRSHQQALWQFLLDPQVNWLKPLPVDPTRSLVSPKDERRMEVLIPRKDSPLSTLWFPELQKKIEIILETEALEISPLEPKAMFAETQEIREGWLVLKRVKEGS